MDANAATSKEQSSNLPNKNDPFNMNSMKQSLFDDQKKTANLNDDCHNEEFFDAKEEHESESEDELDVDEGDLVKRDKDLSDEELENYKKESDNLKKAGNECFKAGNHKEAVALYTRGLNICPLKYTNERSILFANRAAALIGLEKKDDAVLDCSKAIELNPKYLRAVLRRAQLHRKMDNLERCLEDYKAVLELDKNNMEARQACTLLPDEINEKNEKMKNEMFGKLKELGNICLKPFGLSTENFKLEQNPETGGYSVNFQK